MKLDRSARQALGVQKWIDNKCRASIIYATGVGKTRTAILAINRFLAKNKNKSIVVIVPTDYLKVQWTTELLKNGLINDVSVEIINSAIKRRDIIDLAVIDECHKTPSAQFIEIFNVRRPKLVLGLSATFNRLDGRHELLYKYCPPCDVITIKEAIENNWLSPYKEYKVLIDPIDIQVYRDANAQFMSAFSFFGFDFNVAMNCLKNIVYRRTFGKAMGQSPKDVDAQVFTWFRALKARKEFIMNHPIKIEIAQKILDARPNAKAITFSATIKQAELIKRGVTVHSGKTKKRNRLTMEEFNHVKVGVINSSKSLDEGVDCQGLNLAIILCNTSSPTQKVQRVG